jgi:hypothetical protein
MGDLRLEAAENGRIAYCAAIEASAWRRGA